MKKMKINIALLIISISLLSLNSCKKEEVEVKENETSTVTDLEGNVYKTVKIGDQWWMAENLRVTKYNDGSSIIFVDSLQTDSTWAAQTEGAFCKTDNRYGMLYNWFAVNDSRSLAPAGWHIPTDEEWKTMEKTIGMSTEAANQTAWRGTNECEKIIPKSSAGWPSESTVFGTNESGFSALPGGCRLFNGEINNQSNSAFWWTSTAENNEAWYRYIDRKSKKIFRQHTYQKYGLSIRCVKD